MGDTATTKPRAFRVTSFDVAAEAGVDTALIHYYFGAKRELFDAVFLRRADDGHLEAVKFPREGAGLLSSLVETDGLVELVEDVTRVQAGDIVGFLSYANLI